MSLTLSQVIEELQSMRRVLPPDAPVRAWLLSPAAGVPEMAVLEICGVTGGVDRRTGRLCTTLQLRLPNDLPHAAATAAASMDAEPQDAAATTPHFAASTAARTRADAACESKAGGSDEMSDVCFGIRAETASVAAGEGAPGAGRHAGTEVTPRAAKLAVPADLGTRAVEDGARLPSAPATLTSTAATVAAPSADAAAAVASTAAIAMATEAAVAAAAVAAAAATTTEASAAVAAAAAITTAAAAETTIAPAAAMAPSALMTQPPVEVAQIMPGSGEAPVSACLPIGYGVGCPWW